MAVPPQEIAFTQEYKDEAFQGMMTWKKADLSEGLPGFPPWESDP